FMVGLVSSSAVPSIENGPKMGCRRERLVSQVLLAFAASFMRAQPARKASLSRFHPALNASLKGGHQHSPAFFAAPPMTPAPTPPRTCGIESQSTCVTVL